MSDIGDFLLHNYYSRYTGNDPRVFAGKEVMEEGLKNHPDKIVIIRDDKIKGVAVFLTLSDETYERLNELDIEDVDILVRLLKEEGKNIHFILLAADCVRTILRGILKAKQELEPKTISWWSPDLKKLHKYNLRRG